MQIVNDVHNLKSEEMGDNEEIMLDMRKIRGSYAESTFCKLFKMDEKLFAVPWIYLTLDTLNNRLTLNKDKERVESARRFDNESWFKMARPSWHKCRRP